MKPLTNVNNRLIKTRDFSSCPSVAGGTILQINFKKGK